jgi:ubiquinone/menaquinone biosynthesis C-methylase UbiE
MTARLRTLVRAVFQRAPRTREFALSVVEGLARPLLLPFRLPRPRSVEPSVLSSLEAQTDHLNAAAERYFATYPDPEHLIAKPFSEPEALSRRLIDLGVLIDGLRIEPGQTVLELGAGTAWVSHFLNLYGCRTIAVDVSPTALSLARQVFERDPRTRWELKPDFVPYDGHTLPFGDATIDRVVIYDAYHHLPNPERVLRELRRVLTADGIAAMSEPGRGHADSASSQIEAATGVLETELVLEDIADLAVASGFAAAHAIVASDEPLMEVDAHQLRAFMGGRGFSTYWKRLCAQLDGHHYIVLFAGDPRPTTQQPKRLRAVIRQVDGAGTMRISRGQRTTATFEAYNAGDTVWLHQPNRPGWTRFGAHLYRGDASRTLVDFNWLRVPLARDVAPGATIRLTASLPAIADPGEYVIVTDLVIEGKTWFAGRGSMARDIACRVD